MSHNHSLAEANLRLAADTMERTGWTVARLIAASVETDANTGRPGKGGPQAQVSKLGVHRAAAVMSKSHHTIRAYLAAWNAAARDGLCVPSTDLTPEDGWATRLPDADWGDYYTNTKQRGVGIDQVEKRAAEDPAYRDRLAEVVAPERTAAATLNEWAGSERQMKGILSGTTGSGSAARRFIREAIKADPAVALEASQALEGRAKESEFAARAARADEREEAERKDRGGIRYLAADGLIVTAKRKLREAINEIHEAKLSDEHRDLIRERAAEITQLARMLRAEADGNASVDWDAELATLMGGE